VSKFFRVNRDPSESINSFPHARPQAAPIRYTFLFDRASRVLEYSLVLYIIDFSTVDRIYS